MNGLHQRYLAASAALLLLGAALLFGVDQLGKRARVHGAVRAMADNPPVVVARDSQHVVELLQKSGLRGRVLVHFGNHQSFEPPRDPFGAQRLDHFPFDIEENLLLRVRDRNLLWMLMRLNVAREVRTVMPPDVYTQHWADGVQGQRTTDASVDGLRRIVSDHVPTIDEPVVLLVGASLFSSEQGRALAADLQASSLRTDLLVCNLASDNTRVGNDGRLALMKFVRALEKRP